MLSKAVYISVLILCAFFAVSNKCPHIRNRPSLQNFSVFVPSAILSMKNSVPS
jgi:hypothetical protein